MTIDPEVVGARGVEQPFRSTDVEPLLGLQQIGERRLQGFEELPLACCEPGILELPAQPARTDPEPGNALVQVLPRPLGEAGVDRVLECHGPFRHPTGRGDHDRHHECAD